MNGTHKTHQYKQQIPSAAYSSLFSFSEWPGIQRAGAGYSWNHQMEGE